MSTLPLQCLFGIKCDNFVMIAADQTLTLSVLLLSTECHKLHEVANDIVVGLNGGVGDMEQFAHFLARNLQLYRTRNRYSLSTAAVAHFARKTVVEALHRGMPSMLNMLIAGYDRSIGSLLYTMDFLGFCCQVPYATHGIGGFLAIGIIQYFYKPTLTEEQAYEILKICVYELHQRMFLNYANFEVKTVSKYGVKVLPPITLESMLVECKPQIKDNIDNNE